MVRFFFPVLLGGSLVITSLSCAGLVEQIDTAVRKATLEQQAAPTLTGLAGALNIGINTPSVFDQIAQMGNAPSASPPTGTAPAFPLSRSTLKALAQVTGATLDITCDPQGTLRLTYSGSSVPEGEERTFSLEAHQCTFPVSTSDTGSTVELVTLDGALNLSAIFPPGATEDADPIRVSINVPDSFTLSMQTFSGEITLTSTSSLPPPLASSTIAFKNYTLLIESPSSSTIKATLNGTVSYLKEDRRLQKTEKAVAEYTQFVITGESLSGNRVKLTFSGKINLVPGNGGAQCTIGAYEVKTLEPLVIQEDIQDSCPQSGKVEVQGATSELHAIYIFQGSTILVQDPDHPDIQTTVACEAVNNNAKQCGFSVTD
jgi:hypothetical protein